MDRDEEMGHGDRSLLFIGDEGGDLRADRDGGSPPSSSDPGSFSDRSEAGSGDDADDQDEPDGNQQGTWPQSYRQSIDMMSAVPSPTVSTIMAASPSLSKFRSSFFLKKGASTLSGPEGSLPLTRPLLPSSLSQLSQPPVRQSTDSLPPRPPAPQGSAVSSRPSGACLKSNYIDLPPPSSKCSNSQSIINGLNVLCGVGILTTCFGIKQGGWLSLLLLPLLGGSSCYTGLLLKKCMDSSPSIRGGPTGYAGWATAYPGLQPS